jgi:hypothetical protein
MISKQGLHCATSIETGTSIIKNLVTYLCVLAQQAWQSLMQIRLPPQQAVMVVQCQSSWLQVPQIPPHLGLLCPLQVDSASASALSDAATVVWQVCGNWGCGANHVSTHVRTACPYTACDCLLMLFPTVHGRLDPIRSLHVNTAFACCSKYCAWVYCSTAPSLGAET